MLIIRIINGEKIHEAEKAMHLVAVTFVVICLLAATTALAIWADVQRHTDEVFSWWVTAPVISGWIAGSFLITGITRWGRSMFTLTPGLARGAIALGVLLATAAYFGDTFFHKMNIPQFEWCVVLAITATLLYPGIYLAVTIANEEYWRRGH